jgi:hypothetical protein
VGSRSDTEKAYIAGFLDGDGSIMLQVKRRSDTSRGYRFMATICLYQDARHDTTLYWIRNVFGIGYISKRNDGITEFRINGIQTVSRVLIELKPYIRFKKLQTEAMIRACRILERNINMLSEKHILDVCELILLIQNENYQSRHKKTKEELLKVFDLTP